MLIFLIGMPGSGKSFVVKQLAEYFADFSIVDLDKLIEQKEKKSIKEIITNDGTTLFRAIEQNVLKETIASNISKNTIIATGGGTPCFYDNLHLMKKTGTVIYLDVPMDILQERLWINKDRPLLNSGTKEELYQRLKDIYEERQKIYEQADVILHYDNTKGSNFADKIKSIIKSFKEDKNV